MKHRNCPNCGAPYNVELVRCPYCETAYFDMSTIDIDAHEPFFLKIKTKGMIFTQLVVPVAATVESHTENTIATDSLGRTLHRFPSSYHLTTNLELSARPFQSERAGGKTVFCLAEMSTA